MMARFWLVLLILPPVLALTVLPPFGLRQLAKNPARPHGELEGRHLAFFPFASRFEIPNGVPIG